MDKTNLKDPRFLDYEKAVRVAMKELPPLFHEGGMVASKMLVTEGFVATGHSGSGTNWAKATVIFTKGDGKEHRIGLVTHANEEGWSIWEHVDLSYNPFTCVEREEKVQESEELLPA